MILGWVAAAVYVLVLFVVSRRYADRRPHLVDYPASQRGPMVSVIIPARNESLNIEPCLRSILHADYRPLEVIVVDDRSGDDTAAAVERVAAQDTRVRLVRGTDLPTGWFGKQWAIQQGYQVARGELLLFADADTRHTPELIARAVSTLDVEKVDLVTVLPRQAMETFWERLLQPQVFFVLGSRVGKLERVNRTRRVWDALANGQFILTPRATYQAVGTHERVRDTVVDDVGLAQAYVKDGKNIFLVHAQEFMATRMYRSLREIVNGWSKNLATGAPEMLPPVAALRRAVPWLMWLPALVWVAPPVVWAFTGWGFAAVATLASLMTFAIVCEGEGAPVQYALLYPVGAVIVAYIMLRSAARGTTVEWKGRVYAGSEAKTLSERGDAELPRR